jgi:hypothetical protein
MTFTIALLGGAVAGIVHVLSGPDHLAAVSPIVAGDPRRSWRVGLYWGLGHASGVWAIAAAALIFKQALPLGLLEKWSEWLVGVVLIAVGLWTLRRALQHRIHHHEHVHDGTRHSHFHLHHDARNRQGQEAHRHSHAPLGIGLLHGIAGGRHLVGVLPVVLLPTRGAALAYTISYGLGAMAAMVGFAWIMGGIARRWMMKHANAYSLVLGGFSVLAIGVGMAWLLSS